jgi:DNA-binding HxlR family transcriptional regulator
MKQKLSSNENAALKKKIEKISHFLGDLMAKEAVKKEVRFEKIKRKIEGRISPAPSITLKKIDELQEKILVLKKEGKYPPEKIAKLEERLTNLEKKLSIGAALTSKETIKHRMLFGPGAEKIKPAASKHVPIVEFKEEIEKLPFADIPPPPKKKKLF